MYLSIVQQMNMQLFIVSYVKTASGIMKKNASSYKSLLDEIFQITGCNWVIVSILQNIWSN